MTRFMRELSGELGEWWKKGAEKELAKVQAKLDAGEITIDEYGVARNCIGRVLMSDMLEKVALLTDKVSVEATTVAREVEVAEEIREYKANRRPPSDEELFEMRAAYGSGATVVDVLTGEEIHL